MTWAAGDRLEAYSRKGVRLNGVEVVRCAHGPHEMRGVVRNDLQATLAGALAEGVIRTSAGVASVSDFKDGATHYKEGAPSLLCGLFVVCKQLCCLAFLQTAKVVQVCSAVLLHLVCKSAGAPSCKLPTLPSNNKGTLSVSQCAEGKAISESGCAGLVSFTRTDTSGMARVVAKTMNKGRAEGKSLCRTNCGDAGRQPV